MADVSYVPGALTAVVGERCLALVDAPPGSPLVTRIWQQLGQGAWPHALLAGLLGDGVPGAGFDRAPGFALLAEGDGGARRLFCRGAVGATVLGGTAAGRVDGADLLTWREQAVQADAERIILGEPPDDGALRLPATAGVVLATRVIVDLTVTASRGTVPSLVPSSSVPSSHDAEFGPMTERATSSSGLVARKADNALPAADGTGGVGAGSGPDDEYDFFWGATQGRSVADAAIRSAAEAAPPPAAQPWQPPPSRADTMPSGAMPSGAMPSAPGSPAGPGGGPAWPGGLIDAVPWGPGLSPLTGPSTQSTPISWAGAPPAGSPENGFTVKRADLAAFTASSAPPPDRIGPAVPALICPAGHVNPTSEAACGRCGAPLPHDPVVVSRPVLGVLRLSVGDVITLDRGVVMGRSPRADFVGADGEERPHVVRLPSADGDISRNHLRVTLDGWHVLVTDLNSTNGTLITLPGRDPEQLRPGEAVPIKPGTVVALAEGIDFRYEESP